VIRLPSDFHRNHLVSKILEYEGELAKTRLELRRYDEEQKRNFILDKEQMAVP
jgi:hypothetical protein